MNLLLTQLLGLPGIEVEDYSDLGDRLILTVEAATKQATCPQCGEVSRHLHQNHDYLVRDLDMGQRQTWLKVNRRQFKCQTCSKPFSEPFDFIQPRRKYTDRFALHIVQQVLHSDTHNVALNNGLTDDVVWSMVESLSKKNLNIDLRGLKRLGIDEIALQKGQKNFITVLVDLDRKTLIGLAPSRLQKDIRTVIESWGSEILSEIIEVSIDLSGNYRGLVQKMLPQASIVADRFHVTKIVNEDVNQVRRAVLKANENNPDPMEKVKVKEALKQSKYALLKPEAHLTDKQKLKLAEVKAVSPLLAEAHRQKEAFRDIFQTPKNWTEGTLSLLDWLAENQKRFHGSVGTLCRWFGEVTAYFDYRTTSGAVEGINNKLKLIKRSGYGFRNFANFRLRCLICWHLNCSSA